MSETISCTTSEKLLTLRQIPVIRGAIRLKMSAPQASVKSAQTLKYTMFNKNILTPDEADLHELSHLAGVTFDANVFKIIVDLLRLNVAPTAIEKMLKSMTQQGKRGADVSGKLPPEGSENIPPVTTRGRHISSGSSKGTSRSNQQRQ